MQGSEGGRGLCGSLSFCSENMFSLDPKFLDASRFLFSFFKFFFIFHPIFHSFTFCHPRTWKSFCGNARAGVCSQFYPSIFKTNYAKVLHHLPPPRMSHIFDRIGITLFSTRVYNILICKISVLLGSIWNFSGFLFPRHLFFPTHLWSKIG